MPQKTHYRKYTFSKKNNSSNESDKLKKNNDIYENNKDSLTTHRKTAWGSSGYLVIVESPSKCSKIEHYLGPDYRCIASKGHLREINGLENINIKEGNYEITYSIIDDKRKHIYNMSEIIKDYSKDNIFLASDDDREGEAIAWHICDVFDLDPLTTKRIVFHEITKEAVCNSIENPRIIDMKLVKAQQARQVLDIIVGFKVSPVLWKYISRNKQNPLSAGRCQTPALRLIYDNQKLINESTHNIIYKTQGYFFSKNVIFNLDKDFDTHTDVINFLEKSKSFKHILSINESKIVSKEPPKPFNTSKLLQSASSVLRLNPKMTMSFCQQLYQDGYITYMRTDSQKYSKEFLDKSHIYIKSNFGEEYIGDTEKILNTNNKDPHEAIRVTSIENKFINSDDKKLSDLYKLIWKNTVESCMKTATYKSILVNISAPLNYKYNKTIEIPIFFGWKKLNTKDATEEMNSENSMLFYINSIDKTKDYSPESINCNINITHKHLHYTESSLIQKLEDIGIGRPSTFSVIVEANIDKGYVEKKNVPPIIINADEYYLMNGIIQKETKKKEFCQEFGKLIITPIGEMAIEFLIKHYETLFSYNYTGKMENQLDKIAEGEEDTWYSICDICYKEIKNCTYKLKKIEKSTYKLKDNNDYVALYENNKLCLRKLISIDEETGKKIYEFKSTKPNISIDVDRLKNGDYTFDELNDIENEIIGNYEGNNVYIKNGMYGYYIEWGDKKTSIKSLSNIVSNITFDDVLPLIYEKEGISVDEIVDSNAYRAPPPLRINKGILRIIDDAYSIRSGKFGAYVYYKPNSIDKPQFFSLKKFKKGYLTCPGEEIIQWVANMHNLPRHK
jgi:DNA topoisomerase-1